MKKIILLICLTSTVAFAQQDTTQSSGDDMFDLSLEQLLNLDLVDKNFYLYGYINANLQKTFDYPSYGADGKTKRMSDPTEWTPVKNFHIYGTGNLNSKISYLFNLAYNDDIIEVRNAWGNFAVNEKLQLRVGKMYRKFGLYNERLDQIPTFIGIEAPEMLDADHLFLMRTTNFMVHGAFKNSRREISYALMTDNGENGPVRKLIPMGWDLRYKSYNNSFIIGTSGYASSLNSTKTTSTVALGDGSPSGGILPWMAGDRFVVAGIFFEKQFGKFLVQSEYYNAAHEGTRDPLSVIEVVKNAGINKFQRERFLGDNAEKVDAALVEGDVVTKVKYNVQTWYVRVGYNIQSEVGQFIPYLFVDWMSHPENIRNKDFGGDDESGLADDGKFLKPSVGVVYRPIPAVAIKLDGSYHQQKFNGETGLYPEVRLDFSFAFSNSQIEKAMK
jgi:hypothetical protein